MHASETNEIIAVQEGSAGASLTLERSSANTRRMIRRTILAVTACAILSTSALAAAAGPESLADVPAKSKPTKKKGAKKKKAVEAPAAAPAPSPTPEPTPAPEPPKPVEPPPAAEPVSTTTTTAADVTPPPAPPVPVDAPAAVAPAPPTDEHLRGLEIMVRPGYGSAASDSPIRFQPRPGVRTAGDPGALLQGAAPYSGGFVGQAFLGFRFHPVISGGLRGGLRMTSAAALSDGSTNLSRSSWDAGFYVRGYPLALNEAVRKHIDPWISVGVEYMRDTQSFQRSVPTSTGAAVNADVTLDHHAVAVPISVGVDYRVHPMLSIGPSFEYALSNAIAGCVKQAAAGFTSTTLCSNEAPGNQAIKANGYGVWSASLDLKVTPF